MYSNMHSSYEVCEYRLSTIVTKCIFWPRGSVLVVRPFHQPPQTHYKETRAWRGARHVCSALLSVLLFGAGHHACTPQCVSSRPLIFSVRLLCLSRRPLNRIASFRPLLSSSRPLFSSPPLAAHFLSAAHRLCAIHTPIVRVN